MSNAPLTVALPTSTFLPSLGGVEVGLHNIASRLAARGHRPIVVAPEPHLRALRNEDWGLPYETLSFPPKIWGVLRHVPPLGLSAFEMYFGWLQRRHAIDVWHVTVGYPTGVAFVRFAARRGNAPHLVRCVGEDIQVRPEIGYGARLKPSVDALVRTWLPQAECLVAITESVAEEYRKLGISEDRIASIPNGVDVSRFLGPANRAGVRAKLRIGADDFMFLCVGRHHPKKNFAALIEAAGRLEAAGLERFVIVLAGLGVRELAPLAESMQIMHRLRFVEPEPNLKGQRGLLLPSDDLIALYRAADAFAFPSLIETFGIVLVEAMAAGLPLVTTDAAGCRDIVGEGRYGLMVPANDADAMADGMIRLAHDANLRAELRQKSLARASAFSWDSVVDRYVELYRRLIASHGATAAA